MKTKGAKNKSKFIAVKLKDLGDYFTPDTLINIDARYAFMFGQTELNLDEVKQVTSLPRVEIKKVDLTKE